MTKLVIYDVIPLNMRKAKANANARNPDTLGEPNFDPLKTIDYEPHRVLLLEQNDERELGFLRDKLAHMGYSGRVVQIRQAKGGIGAGRHLSIKAGLRSGNISTQGKGFPVLVSRLEV
jgi:hypothetical protein